MTSDRSLAGNIVTLRGNSIELKTLEPSDMHVGYIEGLNDPKVNKFLVGVKLCRQTKENLTEFVKQSLESNSEILFGIWCDDQDKFCGTVRLHGIEYTHKTGHIGICLFNPKIWGKGIGKEAIVAVTKWALKELDLRWIEAGAYNDNIGSNRLFLAAGYEKMYQVRGKFLLDGEPVDVTIYAARNG